MSSYSPPPNRTTEKMHDNLFFDMFVVFFMVLSNIIFSQVKLNSTAPILRLFLSACGHLKRSCDFCADSNYVNYSELLASFSQAIYKLTLFTHSLLSFWCFQHLFTILWQWKWTTDWKRFFLLAYATKTTSAVTAVIFEIWRYLWFYWSITL